MFSVRPIYFAYFTAKKSAILHLCE